MIETEEKYFCFYKWLFWLCYCVSPYFLLFLLLTFFNLQLPFSSSSFIPSPCSLVSPTPFFSLHSAPWCCEGDGAGSSGFSAGAPALCPTAGPCVDPHPVPVCSAGGQWHGLSGAEEVHPQGPGSQVQDRLSFSRKSQKLFLKEGVCFTFFFATYLFYWFIKFYLFGLSFCSTQKFTDIYCETWPKGNWVTSRPAAVGGLNSWPHPNSSLFLNCWRGLHAW